MGIASQDILRDILAEQGPIADLFILNALSHYADTVVAARPSDWDSNPGAMSVDPDAWTRIAVSVQEKLKAELKAGLKNYSLG